MNVAGAFVLLGLLLLIGLLLYFLLRKQRQSREDSSEDYKRLFDGIPTPMYIYDDQTFRFLAVNDAAIDQYGYSRDELKECRD